MPASHSTMLSTSFDLLEGSPCCFEYDSQLSAAVAKYLVETSLMEEGASQTQWIIIIVSGRFREFKACLGSRVRMVRNKQQTSSEK